MEPGLRSPPFLALFLDPFGDRIQPSAQPISLDEVGIPSWAPWRQ